MAKPSIEANPLPRSKLPPHPQAPHRFPELSNDRTTHRNLRKLGGRRRLAAMDLVPATRKNQPLESRLLRQREKGCPEQDRATLLASLPLTFNPQQEIPPNQPAKTPPRPRAPMTLLIRNRATEIELRPDHKYPTLWRIHAANGQISDMLNLARAKNAAVAWARSRGLSGSEIVQWKENSRETTPAAGSGRFEAHPYADEPKAHGPQSGTQPTVTTPATPDGPKGFPPYRQPLSSSPAGLTGPAP
jgi:hypothetical protein